MITASQITFVTMVFGPLIALLFWLWYRCMCGAWSMSISMVTGLIANGMTIVALACVVFNILIVTYRVSFPAGFGMVPAEAQPADIKNIAVIGSHGAKAANEAVVTKFSIDGSETTIFLALLYALIILFYVVHRSIIEAKPNGDKSS